MSYSVNCHYSYLERVMDILQCSIRAVDKIADIAQLPIENEVFVNYILIHVFET